MKTNDILLVLVIILQIITIIKLVMSKKKETFQAPKLNCEAVKSKFEGMCMPYAYPPRVGEECDNLYPAYLSCTKQ